MKKIVYSIGLVSLVAYGDLSVAQITKMVTQIHQEREGVKLETLQTTKEPFVRREEKNDVTTFVIPEKTDDVKLMLHAILNGKAYINDRWYGLEEQVLGYTVKYIGKEGVVLRNENSIKKLFLYQERENIIKIEERK